MNKDIVEKIETLISDMNLPFFRKTIKNKHNVRWLLRNIKIENSNHKSIDMVIDLLKEIV